MKGVVISLFDYTGNMVKPWAEQGYKCIVADIQHPAGFHPFYENVLSLGIDLAYPVPPELTNEAIAAVFAFPPCDHLAVSGARWFKGKGLRKLASSINLFATAAEFCESSDAPYMIENPVSTISTYWRKPDYSFHPWEYAGYCEADNYTKKTCLWTGGGFIMPEKALGSEEPDDRIHKCPPGPDRANIRSATPMGFAKAVFEANKETAV